MTRSIRKKKPGRQKLVRQFRALLAEAVEDERARAARIVRSIGLDYDTQRSAEIANHDPGSCVRAACMEAAAVIEGARYEGGDLTRPTSYSRMPDGEVRRSASLLLPGDAAFEETRKERWK